MRYVPGPERRMSGTVTGSAPLAASMVTTCGVATAADGWRCVFLTESRAADELFRS